MKITCHACDAKYTIADEKVTGRTVKIKCKKCGATIVVAADQAGGGGAPGAPNAEPQHHGGEDDMMATRVAGQDGAPPMITAPEWTVSVAEGDERQMSQLQLAEEMQRGVVTGDTYVWRDGMGDWLSVSQVPELAALLARAAAPPAMTAPGGYAAAGAAAPRPVEDEPHMGLAGTMVMSESPMMSPLAAAPRPAAGAPAAETPAPGLAAVNQPTAARRAARAERPSVDVFQAAAENQPREPEKQRPKPPTPAGKLGERNENSVLFSLSALTATENAAKGSSNDEAVLDLGLGGGSKNGRSAVDDLMNIGGGGIGGPMLAPPPLLAPVVEAPPPPAPVAVTAVAPMAMGPASYAQPTPQPKSKAGLIIGIVAAVAVIGGVGAFFALGSGGGSGATTDTASTASGVTSAAPSTTSAPSPVTSSAPASTEAPAASGDPAATSAVASNDSKTQGTGVGGPAPKGSTTASGAPTASAKASAAPSSAPTAAPTATDTGTGGGRDFNKGAATTALSAAAGRAKGCKTADGPTGSASVRVVFAPSGNVTSANVQGPPFAGTPVGGCIAAAFRGASVPAFDGSPVAVTKTVNIN